MKKNPTLSARLSYVLLIVWSFTLLPLGAMSVHADSEEETDESASFEISDFMSTETVRNAYLLLKLEQYLNSAEENYNSLEERMEDARTEIDENRATIDSLEGQIEQLESLITETQDKIDNVELQKAQKEIDIQDSLESIEFTELQIEEQKRALEAYFQLLYFQKNLSHDTSDNLSGLKILLQEGSVSEVLQKSTYISLLEQQASGLMRDLQDLKMTLKRENYELTVKRHHLEHLSNELEGEYRNLSAQLEGKETLLASTEHTDEVYRELFASYNLAQEAILQEINLFQTNIEALEGRISLATVTMTPEELAMVEQIKNDSQGSYTIQEAADFLDLDWPVEPAQGLSAFFDDSGYESTFGVPHHALDVPIAHGSVIYAPADGVVYKVYDAAASSDPETRLGYGYLIIAHSKGVMTLYGHISAALIQEGDFVRRGQIIGLTGATPGTPGAGGRTTGAHLHFEVIQNGIRVDPLEYLPLKEVDPDDLPEEYLPILQAQLEAELEAANVDVASLEEMTIEDLEAAVQATLDSSILPEDLDDEDLEEFWTQGEEL